MALSPATVTILAPRWSRRAWIGALAAWAVPLRAGIMTLDLSTLAPAGARPLAERGSWDIAIADAIAGLSQALAREHGPLSFHRWRLPSDLDFAAAQEQLRAALGNEWEPVHGLPQRTVAAQMCAWQRKAGARMRPVFALAWLDAPVKIDEGPAARLVVTAAQRQD